MECTDGEKGRRGLSGGGGVCSYAVGGHPRFCALLCDSAINAINSGGKKKGISSVTIWLVAFQLICLSDAHPRELTHRLH